MRDTQFRLLSPEELERLFHSHMKRDFPPDELKPLSRLLELMARGEYEPYGLFREGELAAYALYWKAGEDPYVMLDYFAVLPEGRNQGTGSELLGRMLDQFCQGSSARWRSPTRETRKSTPSDAGGWAFTGARAFGRWGTAPRSSGSPTSSWPMARTFPTRR